jgi:hypothetical protein
MSYHTNQQFREPEVVVLGLQKHRKYLVAIVTNANAIAHAEQSAGLSVTAPDGDHWVRAMRCLIFIQVARSIWIMAWSDETGPGVLSRRLAALRFWPSCQQRRGIR